MDGAIVRAEEARALRRVFERFCGRRRTLLGALSPSVERGLAAQSTSLSSPGNASDGAKEGRVECNLAGCIENGKSLMCFENFELFISECGIVGIDASSKVVGSVFEACARLEVSGEALILGLGEFLGALGQLAVLAFPYELSFSRATERLLREHVLVLDVSCAASFSTEPEAVTEADVEDIISKLVDNVSSLTGSGDDTQCNLEPSGSCGGSSGTLATVSTENLPLCDKEAKGNFALPVHDKLGAKAHSSVSDIKGLSPSLEESSIASGITAIDCCDSAGTEYSIGGQSVRLSSDIVSVLESIFKSYALHWCTGAGRRRAVRQLRAAAEPSNVRHYQYDNPCSYTISGTGWKSGPRTESLLGSKKTSYRWSTHMCFGGFCSFVTDFQLASANDPTVREAFYLAQSLVNSDQEKKKRTDAKRRDPQSKEKLSQRELFDFDLDLTRFLSAITCLAEAQVRKQQASRTRGQRSNFGKFLPFGASVREMIDKCVRRGSTSLSCCATSSVPCTCSDPSQLVTLDTMTLPAVVRDDRKAVDALDSAIEALRNIFVVYCDIKSMATGWDAKSRESIPSCRGGQCGGPVPLMPREGFAAFCKDFDIGPRALISESHLRTLFQSAALQSMGLTFSRFVGALASCAITAFSLYPYDTRASSPHEKVVALLGRMQVSKGMAKTFGMLKIGLVKEQHSADGENEKMKGEAKPHVDFETMTPLQAVSGLDSMNDFFEKRGVQKSASALGERAPLANKSLQQEGKRQAVSRDAAASRRDNKDLCPRVAANASDVRRSKYQRALQAGGYRDIPKRAQIKTNPHFRPHMARKPVSPFHESRPVMSLFPKGPGVRRRKDGEEKQFYTPNEKLRMEKIRALKLAKKQTGPGDEDYSSTFTRETDRAETLAAEDKEEIEEKDTEGALKDPAYVAAQVSEDEELQSKLEGNVLLSQLISATTASAHVGKADEAVETLLQLSRKIRHHSLEEKIAAAQDHKEL